MIYNNKKGQNITQPYVIILIVIVIAIISTSLSMFGQEIASDPDNKLDQRSIEYIYTESGFRPSTNKTTEDFNETFYGSETDNEGNLKDFALEYQNYREQSSQIRTLLQDFFKIPTFFVDGLFLDAKIWQVFRIIIGALFWTIVAIAMYRFIRNSMRW